MLAHAYNTPEAVVSIIIHEVRCPVNRGGHSRAMAVRIVLIIECDRRPTSTRLRGAGDLAGRIVNIGDRREIIRLGSDAAVAQEGARRLPPAQRVGAQAADVHPAGSVGLPGQSGVARVGQLLLLRNLHPGVHGRASARLSPGPSVAAAEILSFRGRDTANIPTAVWSVSLDC